MLKKMFDNCYSLTENAQGMHEVATANWMAIKAGQRHTAESCTTFLK